MRQTALTVVHELAQRDPRVVFIGSDLGQGTLREFQKEFPDRFFMEGISEQLVVGMAAGLALEGRIPYVNTIATFLTRRCFEQVVLDLCLHQTPVRLIASGGGLVYAPLGPTHLAIEDIAILRALPGMTILAPCDAEEMRRLMIQTIDLPGPAYIRVAKGGDPVVSSPHLPCKIGKGVVARQGEKALIISTGVTLKIALDAASRLAETQGISPSVLHLHTIKPLDNDLIVELAKQHQVITVVEEHTVVGGLGSAVAELLCDYALQHQVRLIRLGIPDQFPKNYGSQAQLMEHFALTPTQVVDSITQALLQ